MLTTQKKCTSENVLIHLGYHKTASTWFQKALFAESKFGFQMSQQNRSYVHAAFCTPLISNHPENKHVNSIVDEANEVTSSGKIFVLSHERLSGYPASGGFDSINIAYALKNAFPNAKIMFCIREQRAMILSAWRQQIVDGGGLTLKHFLQSPEPHIVRMPFFNLDMYCYSSIYKKYTELFGQERVMCTPYELFCKDPKQTLSAIATFMNNEPMKKQLEGLSQTRRLQNPSIVIPLLSFQRLLNILFTRNQLSQNCICNLGAKNVRAFIRVMNRFGGRVLLGWLDRVFRKAALKRINICIQDYYLRDNAIMSKLLSADLSGLGYKCLKQKASENER